MTPDDITTTLTEYFGDAVQVQPESWQVELDHLRLLILLSEDQSWLRALVTIAPLQEATPFLQQLLEANFDDTQETRYAVFQEILWGVFQHNRATLTVHDFQTAITRLLELQQNGLSAAFSSLAETQVRQIIQVAKLQGQSLEQTMQTLDRLYEEGVMGGMSLGAEQRSQFLRAWRYQLERLWDDQAMN